MCRQHDANFFGTTPNSFNHRPKHIKQRQRLRQHNQHRCILLLITLMLLQQVEVHTCRQLSSRSAQLAATATSTAIESPDFDTPLKKRAELMHGTSLGQPEEIFTVDDHMESNYDEYPMIVPKRAALLLDRLMVALHNALEKERIGQKQRIGELSIKNGNKIDPNKDQNLKEETAEFDEGVPQFENMYGDDPTVLMDYDFKDLNSINRATGETLMGKSFQRRANVGGGEGVALLTSAVDSTSNGLVASNSNGVGGGGGGRTNKGRLYWRCYFNAVSCF